MGSCCCLFPSRRWFWHISSTVGFCPKHGEYCGIRIQTFDIFTAAPEGFDLFFMDIHMPGRDGCQSSRLIRAFNHPRAQTVPIIVMTANVFREDAERRLNAGMNDHIGNPWTSIRRWRSYRNTFEMQRLLPRDPGPLHINHIRR